MKAVIFYYSKTGFTRKYANWLADTLECEAIGLHEAKTSDWEGADTIIFASWLHAGNIKKISWLGQLPLSEKRKAILAVGAAPENAIQITEAVSSKFIWNIKDCPIFYAQGGLNYEKMSVGDKLMMKMFASMMRKKKDKSPVNSNLAYSHKEKKIKIAEIPYVL